MLIDDEVALREWLVATLEPICDAEPSALARYVLALVTKDKPLDKLRENCIDRLEVFLDRATKDFVDQLFEVIRNGRYIPEAKKENVQPKASESSDEKSAESSELLEAQTSASPTRQENDQQQQIPSTSQAPSSSSEQSATTQQQSSGALIQPVKRRYSYRSSSGRHHSPNPRRHVNASSGGANRHQIPTHYRQGNNSNNQRSHRSSSRSRSGSPPPAKRAQRSYSHSSSGSSSRSSPSRQTGTTHAPPPPPPPPTTNTNFLYKKIPCSDFFDNKNCCAPGDACPHDHGTNPVVFDQQQQQQAYYPHYQQYGIRPAHLHPHYQEYNPEAPDLKHGLHQGPPMFMRHPMHHHPRMQGPPLSVGQPLAGQQQMMMNPQRTLVTVVTNAEPLPLEQNMRQNESMGMISGPVPPSLHTKRHATGGSYPNDRRNHHQQQHQQQQQQHDYPSNNESNNNNNKNNNNNGYNNRGWKRPWQKPDGSGSTPATLEIRKIPAESNTISKLNEHFSKFGIVTNVQIAYDGSPDSALVAYATFHEAETAYKNPQPLFNNRFIKIFWHNSNKGSSSGSSNNNNNNNNSNPPVQQQSSSDSSAAKKSSSAVPNPMKLHWMKMQQLSANKSEPTTTSQPTPAPAATINSTQPPPSPQKKSALASSSLAKKEAAKKAAIEIHRKKQGLLEEQIQQQKLLLKKLETAETNAEKESIRSLMKQVDATIVTIKDSLRLIPPTKSSSVSAAQSSKPTPASKISQQAVLKQREKTLQKQLETLRAKTSAEMRRAMSSTLGQSSLNFPNVLNENDDVSNLNEQTEKQVIVKNINDLPTNDLEEFLKKSGATKIQSSDIDNSLMVTYPSTSDADKILKSGLTFNDRTLDISFAENPLLNVSGKKRTLSETIEDELLGATSTDTTQNEDDDDEPETKRQNRSQTSDVDENEELVDEEDQLLAESDKSTKHANLSTGSVEESNVQYEFESNDLDDDEIQLLDS